MYRHVFPAKLIFFGKSDWIVNSILPRDTTRQVIFPFLFFDPPIFEMGRNVASFLTTFLKTGKLFLNPVISPSYPLILAKLASTVKNKSPIPDISPRDNLFRIERPEFDRYFRTRTYVISIRKLEGGYRRGKGGGWRELIYPVVTMIGGRVTDTPFGSWRDLDVSQNGRFHPRDCVHVGGEGK